jgi:hypothetical protein
MLRGSLFNFIGILFIVGPLLISNFFTDEPYEFRVGSVICLIIGVVLAVIDIRFQIISNRKEDMD